MTRISAQGLTREYRNAAGVVVRALDGVDLTIENGGLTAIVGPSGSGKSALLHCLSGLDRPDAGALKVLGSDLLTSSSAEISKLYRERIGFVFQQYNLVDSLDAFENVLLPQRLSRTRIDRRIAADWFGRLGLAGKEGHLPGQLSGGEQQRVALIRALLKQPAIIFADEPTGALDSSNGRLVLDVLVESAAQGTSVVMVTHDVVAASRAGTSIVLRDGRVVVTLGPSAPATILDAVGARPPGAAA